MKSTLAYLDASPCLSLEHKGLYCFVLVTVVTGHYLLCLGLVIDEELEVVEMKKALVSSGGATLSPPVSSGHTTGDIVSRSPLPASPDSCVPSLVTTDLSHTHTPLHSKQVLIATGTSNEEKLRQLCCFGDFKGQLLFLLIREIFSKYCIIIM